MPLEFLQSQGDGAPAAKAAGRREHRRAPARSRRRRSPQDHQLRLTFAAKTSDGVRLEGGPRASRACRMLDGSP